MKFVKRKKELMDSLLKKDIVDVVLGMIRHDESITMEEVAKRAGVAKGTLYNYFKNREMLMEHVHNAVLAPILSFRSEQFKGNATPYEKIIGFVDTAFRYHDDLCIYLRFIQNKRTIADEISERYEYGITPLTRICKEGIENGSFIDVNPMVLAEMLFGTIFGGIMSCQCKDNQPGPGLDQIKSDVIRLIDRIIVQH